MAEFAKNRAMILKGERNILPQLYSAWLLVAGYRVNNLNDFLEIISCPYFLQDRDMCELYIWSSRRSGRMGRYGR